MILPTSTADSLGDALGAPFPDQSQPVGGLSARPDGSPERGTARDADAAAKLTVPQAQHLLAESHASLPPGATRPKHDKGTPP